MKDLSCDLNNARFPLSAYVLVIVVKILLPHMIMLITPITIPSVT